MKKVKQSILDLVNNPQTRTDIARHLKTGEANVASALRKNKPDGILTKMRYLEAISKETGIAIDKILEECEPARA